MRDRNGIDLDGKGAGEELGEVEGRETIIEIYYMKNPLFSIKEKFSMLIHKNKAITVFIDNRVVAHRPARCVIVTRL